MQHHAPLHSLSLEPSASDEEDLQKDKLESAKFDVRFQQFHTSRGTVPQPHPTIGSHDLKLFQLYRLVRANGGMDKVTQEMKWRSLYLQLGLPSNSSASQALRQAYRK